MPYFYPPKCWMFRPIYFLFLYSFFFLSVFFLSYYSNSTSPFIDLWNDTGILRTVHDLAFPWSYFFTSTIHNLTRIIALGSWKLKWLNWFLLFTAVISRSQRLQGHLPRQHYLRWLHVQVAFLTLLTTMTIYYVISSSTIHTGLQTPVV